MSSPKFEMRVTAEMRKDIAAAAKRDGYRTHAAWVKEQIRKGLNGNGVSEAPDTKRAKIVATTPKPTRESSEAPDACKHRNKRRLPYGTWCDDCGARLR